MRINSAYEFFDVRIATRPLFTLSIPQTWRRCLVLISFSHSTSCMHEMVVTSFCPQYRYRRHVGGTGPATLQQCNVVNLIVLVCMWNCGRKIHGMRITYGRKIFRLHFSTLSLFALIIPLTWRLDYGGDVREVNAPHAYSLGKCILAGRAKRFDSDVEMAGDVRSPSSDYRPRHAGIPTFPPFDKFPRRTPPPPRFDSLYSPCWRSSVMQP